MSQKKMIDSAGNAFVPGDELTSQCPLGGKINTSRIVHIEFETDPKVVADLLPSPLEPVQSNLMSLSLNEMQGVYPDGELRPFYREMVIGIPAQWKDKKGTYNVQLLLDETDRGSQVAPILAGVLLYGYNKHEANFDLEVGENTVAALVSKRGKMLASGSFKLGPDLPMPENRTLPDMPAFGVKSVPSAEKGVPYDVLKLLTWSTCDYCLSALKTVDVDFLCDELKLDGTDMTIPIGRVVQSMYIEAGFRLSPSEVIWDYLQT